MRSVVAIASLWLAGCFYIDPINQRPSLDIRQDSVEAVFRGDEVAFTAVVVDPDDHDVDVTWRAYLCTDAATFANCDGEAAFVGDQPSFAFTVPMTRLDGTTPVAGLRLVLDGKDDHGATAKPTDQLQLPVLDRSPTLEVRKSSVYEQAGPQYVVDTPIDIYALYTDGDDDLDTLTVDWKVYPPAQVPIDLTDGTIDSPMGKRQVYKVLRPQIAGEWTVEITVADPGGNAAMKSLTFNVVPDRAPCIASVDPIVPPPTLALEVRDPTVFQVPIVSDDLDSYPRATGGSEFGEATFRWSILGPTGGRQIVATDSDIVFDPDVYVPGTIVEVRVEIADRKLAFPNCTDSDPTCSVGANSCIQRQTWRVEAR